MVKKLKIGNRQFTYVFKHRWEKDRRNDIFDYEWKKFELGIWYKKYHAVGMKHYKVISEWGKNTVPVRMIGLELLCCRMWLEFSKETLGFDADL